MANTLTNLIPTLYSAVDTVSRELVGFIPAVAVNAEAKSAALNETITVPVTGAETAYDITPGVYAPDNGDTTVGSVNMSITKNKMVPVRFSGDEMLGLENGKTMSPILQNRFTQAFRTLTNAIEADLAGLYLYASRSYGTADTPFASGIGESAQIRKILEDNGAPLSDAHLIVNTAAGANLRTLGQLTSVNQAGTDATLRNGVIGNLNGLMIGQSAQILTPASGTGASATTNAAGYAVGATIIPLASAGTGTLLAGDVISLAGDANYYVVASGNTDVSGGGTITLAAPGLRQAIGTSATAITVVATTSRNMAFDRNAIQLLARVPQMPSGGDSADDVTIIVDPVSGIPFQVALYRQYRQLKYEIGIAWGVKAIKPEHIALLLG